MKTFKNMTLTAFIIRSSRRAVKYTAGLAATLLGIAGLCALAAGNVAGVLVALIGANAALGVKEAAND